MVLFLFLCALLFILSQSWAFFLASFSPNEDVTQVFLNRALVTRGALTLLSALADGHLLFLIVTVPLIMAPAIAEEREHSTLETLLSSPISIEYLIHAKLISPLVFLFLLLTAAIPVLSLCFLGGSLGIEEVVMVYLILLVTTFTLCCVGLFCSTLRPRVYEVYLITAGVVFFLYFLLPFHGSVWEFLSSLKWQDVTAKNHGFHYISPFVALYDALFPASGSQPALIEIPDPRSLFSWKPLLRLRIGFAQFYYFTYSLCLGFLMLRLSIRQVRRVVRGDTGEWREQFPSIDENHESTNPLCNRDYFLTFESNSNEGNLGLELERKVQWFARLPVLMRLFYSALMISIITLPLASYEGSWLYLILPFLTAALFTLPLAATSISSDRQRQTLDLLRTSPLGSEQIVFAKFTTNLQYSYIIAFALYLPGMLLQIICAWVLDYKVDLITDMGGTFSILSYPILLFCSLLAYTSLGLFFSAYCRSTNRAMLLAGTVILISILAPVIVPANLILANQLVILYPITFVILLISPLAGIAALFPPGQIKMEGLAFLLEQYGLYQLSFFFSLFQCLLCLLLTYWLLKKTVYTLDHLD